MSELPLARWRHLAPLVGTLGIVALIYGLDLLHQRAMQRILPDYQREVARGMALSRTYERPLPDKVWNGTTLAHLSHWRPVGDGLSFLAAPSFGDGTYAVVLRRVPGAPAVEGVLAVDPIAADAGTKPRIEHFKMPVEAYEALIARVDQMTDGWPGEGGLYCFDGTHYAFERVRGDRITSGQEANCEAQYDELGRVVLRTLRKYGLGDGLPAGDNWHPVE